MRILGCPVTFLSFGTTYNPSLNPKGSKTKEMQRALSGTQENDFWNVQFENSKKNGRSLTRKISHAFNEAFHTNVATKHAVLNRVRSENFNTKKARFF